ncbi:hypothetical protein T440DRAFT_276638 [Plenodomus tracheiphilus IPT5]|uniref:Uncharacterized protein n=1 Tax=Plenodomus tracheiphilus IPT5 TaxID=1408161 RepID=A0A6A7AQ98_9PLEO|nr:hypothetical protein T440DRAFT_276638 [Plenodomus tracheiphilus IPT5]
MAKKKKPAGNPARGFATTSIPSKPKPEKLAAAAASAEAAAAQTLPEESATADAPANHIAPQAAASHPELLPTPEELEAQLERDELQLLVEKHAPKVRREANRHVAKLQTDRRVLRAQSHAMTAHDWLPRDIVDSIVLLAQAEANDSNRRQGQQPLLKVLSEDDAMARLWTLDLTLRELGFSHDHIQPVLVWLCANAASIDASASVWGLQESLEWLALDHCEDYAFTYDEGPKRSTVDAPDVADLENPPPSTAMDQDRMCAQRNNETEQEPVSDLSKPGVSTPVDSDNGDAQVSDLDTDLELDELIPTYLKIKAKLYEIDPQLVEMASRKSNRAAKSRKAGPAPAHSPATRKLLSQLQQLRSDALFDEYEAEAQWPSKRNEIAQSQAAKRTRLESQPASPDEEKAITATKTTADADIIITSDRVNKNDDEDDEVLLGDMFLAVSDAPAIRQDSPEISSTSDIVLRDFGKVSGMSPRKVLEEAVRSRWAPVRPLFL